METLIKDFFKGFYRQHKKKIFLGSFWRLVACVQTLFWPFAFAKILNIVSQDPSQWKKTVPWMLALIVNKALEDFVRLRSKYRLQRLVIRLKSKLASFFTEETELKQGVRTGEAVQDVKKTTETTARLASYYKNNFLQLPVNLIVIPFILLKADTRYFVLVVGYTILYLVIDYFWAVLYSESQQDAVRAGEEFWGATYRKAPDVWRGRENGDTFKNLVDTKAKHFFIKNAEAQNIHYWRWTSVQVLSSLSRGAALVFVLYLVVKGLAPVGDLVLVSSYFVKTQNSLNILTSTVKKVIDWRVTLDQLGKAVKKKTPS